MIRRPPRSTLSSSSAASDVYKRQVSTQSTGILTMTAMVSSMSPSHHTSPPMSPGSPCAGHSPPLVCPGAPTQHGKKATRLQLSRERRARCSPVRLTFETS
eukprot:TRINITY_DN1706_c0_g1_i4.p1 TRINITY_DN1706_c0_g1~~TRINITY_DN1706_c0_g1_i4.p1  ORF type:complete len:101 (-),score=13.60 TRINITY_DN1706_c0_g1_i4:155-457(-)